MIIPEKASQICFSDAFPVLRLSANINLFSVFPIFIIKYYQIFTQYKLLHSKLCLQVAEFLCIFTAN